MAQQRKGPIRVTVHSAQVEGRIDERIYGHFLEHIFHSVNGGLWGEMVWDRSFEDPPWDGLPAGCTVSGGWRPYGRGKFELQREGAFNSHICQRIVAGRRDAGVQQQPFAVKTTGTYTGSFYVKGSCRGVSVRLVEGRHLLAQQTFACASGEWQRCSFRLRPDRNAERATLRIVVSAGGDVCLDQVSMMSDASRRTGGFRPDLLKAVADLRPPTIRYPGGSFTCWYRWKDGIGPQERRRIYPMRIWDDQDVNSFGTDEFLRLCKTVGAEPILCVNVAPFENWEFRNEMVREACDWIEYCNGSRRTRWGKVRAANGHPEPYGVRLWEIGNEVWNLKPREYLRVLDVFTAAMKKTDPSIRFISCGSGDMARTWRAGDNAVLRHAADKVDLISLHHYEQAERFAEGPADIERFLRHFGRKIARSKNPKLKVYLSEWNAMSTDWRTGLYAGGLLNVLERLSDIAPMACPALFLRHVGASGWDNAFINFDHKGWFPGPNYVVMKLWRDHFAPLRVRVSGRRRPVDMSASRTEDGRTLYVKMVNATGETRDVRVRVEGGKVRTASMVRLAAPGTVVRNMLGDPDRIAPESVPVSCTESPLELCLPRLSVGVLRVEL